MPKTYPKGLGHAKFSLLVSWLVVYGHGNFPSTRLCMNSYISVPLVWPYIFGNQVPLTTCSQQFLLIFTGHTSLLVTDPRPPWGIVKDEPIPCVGYHWIWLDPQGPKMYLARQISSPDQCGRRQQVSGRPEPGHPQESIFWESC